MRLDSLSLNHLRLRLGESEALPHWALLGLLSGLVTGAVVLAFRWVLETPLERWLPGGGPEAFAALPGWVRLAVAGALVVGLILQRWRGAAGPRSPTRRPRRSRADAPNGC